MARARVTGTTGINRVSGIRQTRVTVGIQGPPGNSTDVLADLSDIDTTTLDDGAVLVWNATTAKWTANTILANVCVEGGTY